MMQKPQKRPQMLWRMTAVNVMLLFCGMLTAIKASDICIKNYIVPIYPDALNRARIQASFAVEYSVQEGRVETVRIVSQRITFAGNHPAKEGTSIPDFERSIKDALTQWVFVQSDAQQTQQYSVSIRFLLANANTEADAARLKFMVKEKSYMPSEITIEAEKIGPDIYLESMPAPK